MKRFQIAFACAAALASAAASADAPDTRPAPRQVQVKIEWVNSSPKSVEALTVAATEGVTGTVSLTPALPNSAQMSITITPRVNPDQTITVQIKAVRTRGKSNETVSTARTFKSGETVTLGGLLSKTTAPGKPAIASEMLLFATATLLQNDAPAATTAAATFPVLWRKLRLAHAAPAALIQTLKWQPGGQPLPEGVEAVIGLTGDRSLLIKSTTEGFARLKEAILSADSAPSPEKL